MDNHITAFGTGGKGYGQAGASHIKRALKGFRAQSGSPQEDIDNHNYTLRQRSRMLYMASPIATSAIKTNRTNTIGLGLKLNPKINGEVLGLSEEQVEQWQKHVKREFALWADRKQSCDATGMNNFYAMQQLALVSWLTSGDVFALKKEKEVTHENPYSLRLHLIEADRCSTPGDTLGVFLDHTRGETASGNPIYDGVETDQSGAVVAYHFRNTHPLQINVKPVVWKRVEAYGDKTGLPNVIHVMNSERPEQYRGVSYLAQVIEPLLQIRRYTESELTAAVVESFFTAFIKTTAETDETGLPINEAEPAGDGTGAERYDPNEYELGAGTTVVMNPNEDVVFADPKRPGSRFDVFVKALCTQIGAAFEIPRDLLLKEFNSSYSASRGAMLEAWKAFKMYRAWFADDFCMPTYEMWLSEAVARGRVKAPGFFSDPLIRSAWLNCEWIGPSQGQLDPIKEVKAEIMAVKRGFTTHEDATVRLNGGDWESNMDQLKREMKRMDAITGMLSEDDEERWLQEEDVDSENRTASKDN